MTGSWKSSRLFKTRLPHRAPLLLSPGGSFRCRYHTSWICEWRCAQLEDSFGPLGAGVNFVENEDSSKRARVATAHAATVVMVTKAIGDRQFSKQEAEKLRKRLDNIKAEAEDVENTDVCERSAEMAPSKFTKHDEWEETSF